MLLLEFLVIVVSLIPAVLATILMARQSRNSPIQETKILAFSFFLMALGIFLTLVSTLLHSPNYTDQLGVHFWKVGAFSFIIGWGFMLSAFILPSLKLKYSSIFLICSNFVLHFSFAIINFATMTVTVENNIIVVNLHPITLIGFLGLGLFFVLIFKKRYDSIRSVTAVQGQEMINTRFYLISGVLVVIFILTLTTRSVPGSPLPYGTAVSLPISFLLFYFSYNISRKVKVWFISSSELVAIIMADKHSGLELFSRTYKTIQNKDFLSSFFKVVSDVIQQTILSSKTFGQITFADRVILAVEGKSIVTFLIVSDFNLTIYSIAKHLTKAFETQFSDELKAISTSKILNQKLFEDFNLTIQDIREYLPL